MTKSGQITLEDIARKLKVSKVTISKALRDHPDISEETKQRVRSMAAKMDYTPNFFARNLSSRKSGTIGLVVPKIAHQFFASAIEAIYEIALQNNYEVILMVSQEDAHREILHLQTLLSMRVDGLLISVSKMTTDVSIYKTIEKMNIPLIFFDRVLEELPFSTVTTDDLTGAFQMVSHAIECGYFRIAHLAGYAHTNIGRNRLQGYENALKENGIPLNRDWIIEGGFAEKDGYDGFRKLFASHDRPQMIFAVTFPVALGILSAAREAGIAIPGELDLISFGGSDYNKFLVPSITSLDQPAQVIGEKATELLLRKIQQPEDHEVVHLVLPANLYVGDTCRKIN
jgi:LacI family transcriptional regulator